MKNWFEIKARADDTAEVSIFDEIGAYGVSAKEFIDALKAHAGKKVTLSINSPGGSVFDALAMYNALRAHGAEITAKVMGVAASAASIIFMAGDKRVMPENAFLMIHNPLTFAYGNADELRDMAEVLDKIAASLVGIYVTRSGKSEDEIKAMLDAETWLNAADALAGGFADEVIAEMKIAASFELDRLPENIRNAVFTTTTTVWTEENPKPEEGDDKTVTDQINAEIAAAGFADFAAVWLLDDKLNSVEAVRGAMVEAREVRALCAAANLPDEAPGLLRTRASLAEARAHLTEKLAASDEQTRVDGALPSSNSKPATTAQPAALRTADVWAARRNIH